MQIKYGIVAVKKSMLPAVAEVMHFCGYENKPQEIDIENLRHELLTDPEMALEEEFVLLDATPEMIEYYSQAIGDVIDTD